ncbi:uncharacterized protein LOC131935855 [Physella acuta]|uniref:uncharacterized protein LOC131935855 n=1 Tax=Physella acuta TaxID=109671 RepID=UPI0027DE628D|nr:uncharacterized protein LOC131935855 [Physella acuta]XP_059148541.1 uncharacterized protein LOC131935855 [Physella acuta]XP_059148542.1 uncharacterized protein LOC131935855 [Physella acuta]XP_059148543.1 uncharacterized protein LOC131935855 [Physella acuta]XP_059148544.1 uncharacterized protein LOC131935855 [Physella acuta]XP_059148545.1 uncharacterized protein LOC131935855 [Physella acuta]XP_059148546.1 uncharacterized protein LOC131935855 [Physella acuta]
MAAPGSTNNVDFDKIAEVYKKKNNISGKTNLDNVKISVLNVAWSDFKDKQNTDKKKPGLYLKLQKGAWTGLTSTYKLTLNGLPADVKAAMGGEEVKAKHPDNQNVVFIPTEGQKLAKSIAGKFKFDGSVTGNVIYSGTAVEQQAVAQIVQDLQGDETVKNLTVTTNDKKMPSSADWKVEGEFEFYSS